MESAESGNFVKLIATIRSMEGRVCARTRLNNSTSRHLGSLLNIGTGVTTSVKAFATMLPDEANVDAPMDHQPSRRGERSRRCVDPARATKLLGRNPEAPLADGLRVTLLRFKPRGVDPLCAARS